MKKEVNKGGLGGGERRRRGGWKRGGDEGIRLKMEIEEKRRGG